MCPSVHNFCRESGNGSRHSDTSPHSCALVISPVAQFIFPNTATEDQRAGAWWASRERRDGRMDEWSGEESKRGGGEESFFQVQFMHFSAVMNRLVGQVFSNLC